MSNQTAKSSGIGLCGATFLVFLVMRLTDHIDWPWYWVAAPLWIPPSIALGIVAILMIVAGIAYGLAYVVGTPLGWMRKRRRQRGRRP